MKRPGEISTLLSSALIVLLFLCVVIGFKGLIAIALACEWYPLLLMAAAALAFSLIVAWLDQL